MKKKILIVHQQLRGLEYVGGAEAICVWTIEALKTKYDISLAVPQVGSMVLDTKHINQQYGTSLQDGDFTLVDVPMWALLRPLAAWSWFLHTFFFMICVRRLVWQYDICLSTYNEFDFDIAKPVVEYIHYPMIQVSTLTKGRRILAKFFGYQSEHINKYQLFTCSNWTAQIVKNAYPLSTTAVWYPPVRSMPAGHVFSERTNNFLVIGRISPEKRIENTIHILADVKARGFDIYLTIVGPSYKKDYYDRLQTLTASLSWITWYGGANAGEIEQLCGLAKYGINGTKDEQFGIAIAEMCRAGCIVFVPQGGGQTEVVADERQIFANQIEAVEKISRVLASPAIQTELHLQSLATSARFDPSQFIQAVQTEIDKL